MYDVLVVGFSFIPRFTRFPDPGFYRRNGQGSWARVMREIESQATQSWKMGRAVAASDLMVVGIPNQEVE